MGTPNPPYHIEPITGDNHRPGTPETGFIIYYRPHEQYGWTGRKCVATLAEAEAFAKSLEEATKP